MSVKIAEKLEQFNNGTYMLMDASAVEYQTQDGNSISVQEALDNASTDNSTHKTVIFENNIDMGKYILLAKITGANDANNIIKFSCPNFKGQNQVGFKYENDMDIYKFELHFNTGARREANSYGVTLKQHGLVLYSYPLNNPQNTEPKIEEAVRLYWDYSKGDIYVFLVDMMTAIPHCVLEYTGSGTLLRENTFVKDDMYNWLDEKNGTWAESKWKSIPFNKLEIPPIYELGGGSSKEGQVEKEDSYIPNVYDRNANGDMPVVGFNRLADTMCLIQNYKLLDNGDTYDEDYVGGWVYTMANDILVKDKEMFNKIKVIVSIPGVLRVGVVNDKVFEANPRYSTCLVKWLVADFVAFTGMKEYDIDDTILEEGQYIFIECRQGESSWYYNQGSTAVTQGKVTYPASSCTSGLNVADKLDSTTNNVVFKSQSVTSKSAIFTFSDGINVGSKLRTNFLAREYNATARTDMSDIKSYNQNLYKGGFNVGLYRRTKYSDTRVCKCIENAMDGSWVGDANVTKIYAPLGQERIVGKSVYAIKLDVKTTGNLTIYHLKGKSLDTVQVIDKYTHYVRAKGLQTIHLPFDIKLNSTDEYIGFGGLHYKSTSDNIVRHSCCWYYLDTSQAKWMTTIDSSAKQFYSIGVSNTVYPEKFTSFETNTNYINIELICRGEKRSPLEDKYISFTGDSITTFAGFCTKQADIPAGNSAGDNAVYYPASGRTVNNVDATWWGILAKDNRMQILRNDAWSGSRVSSTTGSTDTKCLCGTERYKFLSNSSQGTNVTFPFGDPEIIINMIGTNDLSGNVELGEGILYGLSPTEDDYKKLYNAYSLMCQRFASWYNKEGGKVVHFIIPRGSGLNTYANSNGDSIQKVALEFEKIAKSWGQYFIPLPYFTSFNMAIYKNLTCPTTNVLRDFRNTTFNNSDGLHPNVVGMEVIADGVHRFLCSIM